MDEEFIKRILNGDSNAYSYFVDKYKDVAYSIAYRVVHDAHDAEEIIQDAFVKAYQAIDTLKDKGKYSTWLYKIVYNVALSRCRKMKVQKDSIEEVESEMSIDQVYTQLNKIEKDDQKKFIQMSLDQLDESENIILTLFYLNENSVEEISNITGISKSNIKIKLHRARKKLYLKLTKILKHESYSLL